MDLFEVIQKRITEAGYSDVFATMPNVREHPEAITLALGTTDEKTVYYDGAEIIPYRVTVFVSRVSEHKAQEDALGIEFALATADLDSLDGSYVLDSSSTTAPAPIPWDESGRFVWAFELIIEIRKGNFYEFY